MAGYAEFKATIYSKYVYVAKKPEEKPKKGQQVKSIAASGQELHRIELDSQGNIKDGVTQDVWLTYKSGDGDEFMFNVNIEDLERALRAVRN